MKVSVIVATRSKPHRAAAVIEAARHFASGAHEITYTVAGDLDMAESFRVIHDHYPWIRTDIAPRPVGPGNCWNRVIASHPADMHVTLPDDGFIATPDWDDICANVMTTVQECQMHGLFCWQDEANPDQATVFTFGRAWIEQFGAEVFDERFPFWFSDTGLNELYSFLTGHGIPMVPALKIILKPGEFNPRLRDMVLWWRLFAATRDERIGRAAEARAKLGMPYPANIMDLLERFEKRDAIGLPESEEIVRQIAKPSPITEEYLIAKANAEAYLAAKENA